MRINDDIGYTAISADESWRLGLPLEIHARERRIELRREAAVRRAMARSEQAARRSTWRAPLALLRLLLSRTRPAGRRVRLEARLRSRGPRRLASGSLLVGVIAYWANRGQ